MLAGMGRLLGVVAGAAVVAYASLAAATAATPSAGPTISILSPDNHGSYERGAPLVARFRCSRGASGGPVISCKGSVPNGHRITTRQPGRGRFTVIAIDKSGDKVSKTVSYTVWRYANPLRAVHKLERGRIDMGVDYAGSGPLLALGDGRITFASNHDSGPSSCYTCWPGGGAVVYRLTDGPFAGKYVYVAEKITVVVKVGQTVRQGQRIAILHDAYPNMEIGWAAGKRPLTLARARGDQCPCGDPGGWSTIEGRNFNRLLVVLGAPSGYLQPNPPKQRMPKGWPHVCRAAPYGSARSCRSRR